MRDAIKKLFRNGGNPIPGQNQQPAPAALPTKFQMTITIDMATGQTNVNGPLLFKHVCYAMLEQARSVVDKFDPNAKQIIVPPPGSVPPPVTEPSKPSLEVH